MDAHTEVYISSVMKPANLKFKEELISCKLSIE